MMSKYYYILYKERKFLYHLEITTLYANKMKILKSKSSEVTCRPKIRREISQEISNIAI